LKIIKNIIPAIKLLSSVKGLSGYRKEILAAKASGDLEKEREYILKSTSTWGDNFLKTFDVTLNISGEENIPDKGPVVFVANHQGFVDVPVICAVLKKFQFAFIAKSTLKKIPLYGGWITDIRGVYIDRDDTRKSLEAINEGIDLLNQGFSLVIFPEGFRTQEHRVAEFKKGSLRLATKPGVPVIPITIDGTHHMFEVPGYLKKGVSINIVIHPVIETKGMEKSVANNLSAEVEKIVKSGFAQPLLDS